jgi:hypothetical protein
MEISKEQQRKSIGLLYGLQVVIGIQCFAGTFLILVMLSLERRLNKIDFRKCDPYLMIIFGISYVRNLNAVI